MSKLLAEEWIKMGYAVHYYFGVNKTIIQADILIPQIDLTFMPSAYAEFISKFSGIVINYNLTNISKGQWNDLEIERDSIYPEQVIVKPRLNYKGYPEIRLGSLIDKLRFKISKKIKKNKSYYQVYSNKDEVPLTVWDSKLWIVEKFIPEYNESLFSYRSIIFLGDQYYNYSSFGTEPIIKANNRKNVQISNAPDKLFKWINQCQAQIDYAKIDYVVHNEDVKVLDVNPTVSQFSSRDQNNHVRKVALGINSLF